MQDNSTTEIPENPPLCGCNCGNPVTKNKKGIWNKYVQGHNGNRVVVVVENQDGFCQCGCGEKAPISKKTDKAMGYMKGKPIRFIKWHGRRRSIESRFWEKVDKSGGPDACWPWMAGRTSRGYGNFVPGHEFRKGQIIPAHRMSYMLSVGPIPEGLIIRHLVCDNPPCCNPAHLAIGTQADNMQDCKRKGRNYRGPQKTKMNKRQIKECRRLHAQGWTYKGLAMRYGVSKSTIWETILKTSE